jgi:hypothetical protein
MGFCARQSLGQLAPFIASLRRSAFAGDVCIIVEGVAAETVDRLRAHGIIVERSGPSAQPRMVAMASRYFSYVDFLQRHLDQYANVMLADPSTTIFQADPFAAPLPADIVYTSAHRAIGDTPTVHGAVVQAYGESVAHNIRDCTVSNADTTFGSAPGVLRYLAAMIHQLAGRTTPLGGAIDQGVHNYVVHMRPLRGAWLDPTDTLHALPNNTVEIAAQHVLVGGRVVPVLSHWDASVTVVQHVKTSSQFRLDDSMLGAWPPRVLLSSMAPDVAPASRDAVVAFYQRQRDEGWLPLFLGSLRCVSDAIDAHCVGDFNQDELDTLARFGCAGYLAPATEPDIADNVAHLYVSQVLERLSSSGTQQPDQVLVLDSVRAVFPRDPFLGKTIGLSVFCEGPARLAESDYNRDRLALFVTPDDALLRRPIVSSMALRGTLPHLREFYRRMFAELIGRAELLKIQKVVQGIVNKLSHGGDLGFPVIAHPNGAEVHYEFLGSNLAVDTRHGVRIGGTVPGVVLSGHRESQLLLKLRIDLNLPEP